MAIEICKWGDKEFPPSEPREEDDYCNCAEIGGLWETDYGYVKSITRTLESDCLYPPDLCVGDDVKVGDKVM